MPDVLTNGIVGIKRPRKLVLFLGEHGGTMGSIATTLLQGSQFDPKLRVLFAWS